MPRPAWGDGGVTGGELNFAWARAIFRTLAEYGLEEVEIAPGSRSAPLVLAARSLSEIDSRVHLDERSAGFFAVGYGRCHLGPAAVVTTSGTAVANLLPAVVEADLSDVPLIVITADRPPHLRGADANQTITQPGIFGDRVRFEADLPMPSRGALEAGTRSLVELVRRAARHALGPPAGPVHLNVPFDKPLQPESPLGLGLRDPGSDRLSGLAAVEAAVDSGEVSAADPLGRRTGAPMRGQDKDTLLAHWLGAARRPLLVAGPSSDPGHDGPAVVRFALGRSIPTLADPLSGARFAHGVDDVPATPVLGAYDHFLRVPEVVRRLVPDLIIRVGRTPTSGVLEAALAEWTEATQIVIDNGAHRKDHQGLADHYLRASAGTVLDRLAHPEGHHDGDAPAPAPHLPWTRTWTDIETAAWETIERQPPDADNEGDYAAAVVRALPPGATLFVSSSMPVRDVDAYGRPAARDLQVLGNRGASGIDGIVSSVLGCAGGGAGPVAGLIGDIAFYHDMNGLLAARDKQLNVVFVLVDNDGGGIFHMLPIRHFEPVFTPCFATPHGLDFRHAARMYGLPFTDAATPAELEDAVAAAVGRPGTEVIRVRTDRERNRLSHEQTRVRVARRVNEILKRTRP